MEFSDKEIPVLDILIKRDVWTYLYHKLTDIQIWTYFFHKPTDTQIWTYLYHKPTDTQRFNSLSQPKQCLKNILFYIG